MILSWSPFKEASKQGSNVHFCPPPHPPFFPVKRSCDPGKSRLWTEALLCFAHLGLDTYYALGFQAGTVESDGGTGWMDGWAA